MYDTPRRPSTTSRVSKRSSSNASIRVPNLSDDVDPSSSSSRFSLAHELAFALMPEPSAGSKLLAEELGIEYDDGAEGIDGMHEPSIAEEVEYEPNGEALLPDDDDTVDPAFAAPPHLDEDDGAESDESEQDAMQTLEKSLALTDKFISRLRSLDDSGGTSNRFETMASEMIRHIDETTRDREGQLRELLECEREFRRIAGEVGGQDVLGHLDELEGLDATEDVTTPQPASHRRQTSLSSPPLSPTVPTATAASASAVPHLASLRTHTTSLISSLTVISEHAQVTGAVTADAGRKIRALKNKIGGWRTEWDLAEQSRIKIEKYEASQPVVGRLIVQEHLKAFERALADAAVKTKTITSTA